MKRFIRMACPCSESTWELRHVYRYACIFPEKLIRQIYLTDHVQCCYFFFKAILSSQSRQRCCRLYCVYQKLLSLAEIAISACRDVICSRDSYLCMKRYYLWQRRSSEVVSYASFSTWRCKRECSHRKSALKASPSTRFSAISACRDSYLCQR